MIFARRVLQQQLNVLRGSIENKAAIDDIVKRLNTIGKIDRFSAMWEVVVLHALSRCGRLQHESALESGKRPDIFLKAGSLNIVADITSVSDSHGHRQNPVDELVDLVEEVKPRLGLPPGGTSIEFSGSTCKTSRGERPEVRMPDRSKLWEFLRKRILPEMRRQLKSSKNVLNIEFDDDEAGLKITIDTRGSESINASYPTYTTPTTKDQNPVYNALRDKAKKLSGAEGIKGVVVCDGGCSAMRARNSDWQSVSREEISAEFFRQYSSMQFVLYLTVGERWHPPQPAEHWLEPSLCVRAHCEYADDLKALYDLAVSHMPNPITNCVTRVSRSIHERYPAGFHGGFRSSTMSHGVVKKIGISSRELLEALAGGRKLGGDYSPDLQETFQKVLEEGRLPVSAKVIPGEVNENDDWIEFEFGSPDPAVTDFR